MTLTRSALDGHAEDDTLGVVNTEYTVDVSAATPGYGDYQGSTVRVNGVPVYQSVYTHDSLGRIREWSETIEGAPRVQRFEYDDAGRLVNVQDGLGAPLAEYAYDANGNRTNVVEPGRALSLGVNLGCASSTGVPLARGANDRDELCRHGQYHYTYDANGRLEARVNVSDPQDETLYTYDGGGRLHQVALGGTTVDYVHDALGRRVGRRVNGVFERGWLYKDSLNPVAQVDATGNVEATYVYVTRANVPDYIVAAGGDVYRVVADHLGSVRMLVNATTGAITARYDYDVWGRVTHAWGDHSLHPFGYAGGLYDADTGLVRFGVRDYDADTGRWTAPEPLGFAAEANWYRYAGGDPVNRLDINGLEDHWYDYVNTSRDGGWQAAANFSAGFGDALSFGLGSLVRRGLGLAEEVDECSDAYAYGELASFLVGTGRTLYAGSMKGIGLAARLLGGGTRGVMFAVATRNSMKQVFRMGFFRNFRIKTYADMLARYGSNEAVIAAATRSNPFVTTAGAQMFFGSATNYMRRNFF